MEGALDWRMVSIGSKDIGKCVLVYRQPHLIHHIQSMQSWMREGEPNRAMRCDKRCERSTLL